MTREQKARAKELTMACWWPGGWSGRKRTDWYNVAGELVALADSELLRGDDARALEASSLADVILAEHLS